MSLSRWRERGLAALIGALSVFTYAPFQIGGVSLGWLAPLPLAWLFARGLVTQPATRWQLTTVSWWYGVGAFVAGVHWISVSLSVFGGMPAWMADTGTVLFAMYLALFPMLAGFAASCLHSKQRWLDMVVFAMIWVLSECLRGWLFTGFPWLAVGFSQTDTVLVGFIPVGGVLLASFAVALVAGLLALTWLEKSLKPVVYIVLIYVAGAGLSIIQWTSPMKAPPLTVSLLQGNIPQDLKWNPEFAQQSLDTYLLQLQASKGQLKVLPETALPLFYQRAKTDIPDFLAQVKTIASVPRQGVLMGTPEMGRTWDEYYNSAVLIQGKDVDQWYRKAHLVPLGEYLPLKPLTSWLLKVLNIPLGDMSSGSAYQAPIQFGSYRLAVNICYEDVFGTELIQSAKQANVMINMSNLAWFGKTIALDQHLQIARVRAIENGRPMIRATNTGATAIIDANGKLLSALPYFESSILEGQIQGREGETPYQRLGGDRWIYLLILVLIGRYWRLRRA